MNSLFKEKWEYLEANGPTPSRARNIITYKYQDFKNKVFSGKTTDVTELTESLYAGDGFILKGVFEKQFLIDLRERTFELGKVQDSSFNKMVDGCPDFNTIIGADNTKKYSYNAIRRSYFFFPWNNDPLNFIKTVYPVWEVYKYLGGFAKDEYVSNIPSTGVVDRFQIAFYPAGGGGIESHIDARVNQRMIIGAMVSKRGVDYERGGFYVVGADDAKIDLEDQLEIGDMVCCYPTVVHGVDPVDPHIPTDYTINRGRWFLGLYSNDTDYVIRRRTTSRVDLEIKEDNK